MTRCLWQGLALTATLLAAGPSWAATKPLVVARIPYDFVAAGNALPAGEYEISTDDANNTILVLKNLETKKSTVVAFMTRLSPRTSPDDSLVFDDAAGKHYLSEIYVSRPDAYALPGEGDGYFLPGAAGPHTHSTLTVPKKTR